MVRNFESAFSLYSIFVTIIIRVGCGFLLVSFLACLYREDYIQDRKN